MKKKRFKVYVECVGKSSFQGDVDEIYFGSRKYLLTYDEAVKLAVYNIKGWGQMKIEGIRQAFICEV